MLTWKDLSLHYDSLIIRVCHLCYQISKNYTLTVHRIRFYFTWYINVKYVYLSETRKRRVQLWVRLVILHCRIRISVFRAGGCCDGHVISETQLQAGGYNPHHPRLRRQGGVRSRNHRVLSIRQIPQLSFWQCQRQLVPSMQCYTLRPCPGLTSSNRCGVESNADPSS